MYTQDAVREVITGSFSEVLKDKLASEKKVRDFETDSATIATIPQVMFHTPEGNARKENWWQAIDENDLELFEREIKK